MYQTEIHHLCELLSAVKDVDMEADMEGGVAYNCLARGPAQKVVSPHHRISKAIPQSLLQPRD